MIDRRGLVTGLVLAVCGGCPPAKPTIELPAASGTLTATLVGTIDDPGAPRDPRALIVDAGRLYVADVDGLFVYDLTDPAVPAPRGRLTGRTFDDVAVVGDRAYAIAVGGDHQLVELQVTDPDAPVVVREVSSRTLVFGGLAARPGLIWHAVGANPPSHLFPDVARPACDAPDRERGAMDVWLAAGVALETIHFDDFAGDGLDGNGAFGLASFRVRDVTDKCPDVTLADILFFDTHAKNRSAFERGSASDLQAAITPDGAMAYVTGEQLLRAVSIDPAGRLRERGAVDVPDAIAVAVDASIASRHVIGVGHGDLVLVDGRDPAAPEIAAILVTPGITRAVVFAGDGHHLYAATQDAGVLVVRYDRIVP